MAGHHPSGFHPHLPGRGYSLLAKGIGATMWFFIFYRLRQDGGKLMGHHPFMDHGHDGHASDAGHH
ncbi:hypothetical protein B0H15DRAFT_893408 [Mycena belliarum]|uniref:Uncharacterized protein n=1 Tax=Mycena belliarum TaxID=1033014 RepID=A0AAD6TVZ3_9AGAR|nr:hypothetical protein B0H15DRAFT_893408 [Mycena belliae]